MSSDNVIIAEQVSKKYSKSLKSSIGYAMSDISRNILRLSSKPYKLRGKEFWAVDDVSFEVKQGESLGLIGSNGSGKTTLLQMINGIFWPDKGSLKVRGRVGALIAVGAGFHPMLTGRENIYLNAAILGMTKQEVDKKFDEIVDFADIGDFLDTSVKHYSSGMFVRLGFSIAVHCDPDILLVDEILAVGDRQFQVKCYQKINEIKKRGVTVVLVAHNEYTIREQTQRCLYLNHGKVKYYGSSEDAISVYIKDTLEQKRQENTITSIDENKNASVRIEEVRFLNELGNDISELECGQELRVRIKFNLAAEMEDVILGVNFYGDNQFMYCANSSYDGFNFGAMSKGGHEVLLTIPNFYLSVGKYDCSVVVAKDTPDNLLDWHDKKYSILVGRARNSRGSLKLPTKWNLE